MEGGTCRAPGAWSESSQKEQQGAHGPRKDGGTVVKAEVKAKEGSQWVKRQGCGPPAWNQKTLSGW